MKIIRLVTAGFLLLTLAACSKPEKNLVGTWAVDVDALANTPEVAKLEGEDKKKAISLAKKVAAQMSYEFTDDGKIAVVFGKVRQTGTYKVTATEGKTLTVSTTLQHESGDKSDQVKIEVVDKTKIEITAPDGKSVKFVKQGR